MNHLTEAVWQARFAAIQALRTCCERLWVQRACRCVELLERVQRALRLRLDRH